LDQALGFTDGKPPKDLQARLEKYFSQHPDIRDCLTILDTWHQTRPELLEDAIKYILWIRQLPGGEQSLADAKADLEELHQALGFVEGKPPTHYRVRLLAYLEQHPDLQDFANAHGWLTDKPSPKIEGWLESVILERMEPGAKDTKEAADFLHQVKKQGKLPGWRENDHGMLTLKTQGLGSETYPVYRSFECRKKGQRQIQVYTLVKASPESDWELKRAWEMTARGRFVKEFPVAIGQPLP
jgi:hypothetical protein